jgi:hypothetical protein
MQILSISWPCTDIWSMDTNDCIGVHRSFISNSLLSYMYMNAAQIVKHMNAALSKLNEGKITGRGVINP